MNIPLMKHLGNMEQIAGIRESQLLRGRGEQIHIAEVYNAAGLRFTVVPDRCMDLYDLSYKGMNLSFQSKNGLVSPQAILSDGDEFTHQWPGGMLVTCGLDNVGISCSEGGAYPTHGRISHLPAKTFGTKTGWEGEEYVLRLQGEVHQTQMYGRHVSLDRTIETKLDSKNLVIIDRITNFEAEDEPYMLLYHFNFGYPLLQADSKVAVTSKQTHAMVSGSENHQCMTAPSDGQTEMLFLHQTSGDRGCGVIYNERLELGAYVSFDTKNLPNMQQWKMMKSHDYVLAFEPCNTWGLNRSDAIKAGKCATIKAYSSIENKLELGVLDGLSEIRSFLKNL